MGRSVAEARPTELGLRVQAIREAAGIGRVRLSNVAGFSDAVVYQLESGVIANPSAELVFAIADALGTTAEYLFRGEGEAPKVANSQAAFILACERADQQQRRTGT
jgi:transcriptional regulator with XRE-family HTH domain